MSIDGGTLTTIASITAGFGVAMLFFRLEREIGAYGAGPNWIPWADRLLIAATVVSLLLVILPVVLFGTSDASVVVARAACAASTFLVTGYIFAILAHYRLFLPDPSLADEPRTNPEPAERKIVIASCTLAVAVAIGVVLCAVI